VKGFQISERSNMPLSARRLCMHPIHMQELYSDTEHKVTLPCWKYIYKVSQNAEIWKFLRHTVYIDWCTIPCALLL